MPNVFVPTPHLEEFKELNKSAVKKLLDERVSLYQQAKRIEARLKGDPKNGIAGLNEQVFVELQSALPEDVKSVEYEGHIISAYQGQARSNFDRKALQETEFKVQCPCPCKKKFAVTVPAKVIQSCMKLGKAPVPTVSVRRIGEREDSE